MKSDSPQIHIHKYSPQIHILPCYCHFIDLRLAFTRALLQDPANWAVFLNHCLTRAGHFQLSFSLLSWHEKNKQSRKWCSLLFCFYCFPHIQRCPWCPFPYLGSIFWAQNSNSVTCSYRINKEMNHDSLDKDRALEPSNPQSAHVYLHGRCYCWFYLKLRNAGLKLQQGKANACFAT